MHVCGVMVLPADEGVVVVVHWRYKPIVACSKFKKDESGVEMIHVLSVCKVIVNAVANQMSKRLDPIVLQKLETEGLGMGV